MQFWVVPVPSLPVICRHISGSPIISKHKNTRCRAFPAFPDYISTKQTHLETPSKQCSSSLVAATSTYQFSGTAPPVALLSQSISKPIKSTIAQLWGLVLAPYCFSIAWNLVSWKTKLITRQVSSLEWEMPEELCATQGTLGMWP